MNEARFGLEQSLAQCADNDAARAALAKVETMLEARRQRAVALEHEARERDPRLGSRWRTFSLGVMTLLTLAAAVPSWLHRGPTPQHWLVLFPAAVAAGIALGAVVLRHRVLDTRFNRQVFATVMFGMVMMVALRALALVLPTSAAEQFVRDSFVQAAVMGVCAIAFLRWVAVIAVLFAVTGVACAAFPAWSMQLFSTATVVAMLVAAAASWADERGARVSTFARGLNSALGSKRSD